MLLRLQRTEKQTSESTVHVRGAQNPVPEKDAIARTVSPGTARRLPPLACSLPHWAPSSVSGTGISPIPRPLSIGVPAPASPGGPLPRSRACSLPFITQTLKATCCLSHLPQGLSPESGSTCPVPMPTAAWLPSPPAASPSQHMECPCRLAQADRDVRRDPLCLPCAHPTDPDFNHCSPGCVWSGHRVLLPSFQAALNRAARGSFRPRLHHAAHRPRDPHLSQNLSNS